MDLADIPPITKAYLMYFYYSLLLSLSYFKGKLTGSTFYDRGAVATSAAVVRSTPTPTPTHYKLMKECD